MASSTSLQVAGLASNFDWKSFVDQIMAVERTPADRMATEQAKNTQKVNQLSILGTKLTALKVSSLALKEDGLFGKRTAASATSGSGWSPSAATATATGSYTVAVSNLATAARLAGGGDIGAGLSNSSSVAGLTIATLPTATAVSAGTFTVNGKQVNVALTDSLEDVFTAISTATGGEVTASYDPAQDKITLASTSGNVVLGAANDTSNFLRAMKLGNNGTDSTSSSASLGTVKTNAALASANLGAGVSGSGAFTLNGVSISYDTATDSLAGLITRINDSSAGVSASYDAANDRLVLANKSTGDLGVSIGNDLGNLLAGLGLASGTTFTRGEDALFTINGGDTLRSASNTLDASAHGIAGLSIGVTSEETQTINVAADTGAMRSRISTFISAFNDVQDFLENATKVTTDSKGKVTAGTLASNREIQEWGRSMRTMAFSAITGLAGSVRRMEDLGIDFTSGTSKLEIKDGAKLDKALSENTAQVQAFFSASSTGFAAKFDAFLEKVSLQNDDQQKNLNKANDGIDLQIEAIDRQLKQRREVMESAFILMETAQSKLKQQQTAIEGMFAKSS